MGFRLLQALQPNRQLKASTGAATRLRALNSGCSISFKQGHWTGALLFAQRRFTWNLFRHTPYLRISTLLHVAETTSKNSFADLLMMKKPYLQ